MTLKLGKKIVAFRVPILILSILLLVPAALGMINTRVNYDILSYLPKDIETMEGQDILLEEFGTAGFSLFMTEGMEYKDVSALKKKIEKVDYVADVLWYDSIMDISVPVEFLPDQIRNAFNQEDSTVMAILFETTTSADETMEAIKEIRKLSGRQCFLSGMSAVVTDTKDLSEQETPIYVCIAVVLSSLVLAVSMDSFLVPLFFLLSIGMAILYNLGSNLFLGEISYITKALTAVLQLGVTMDYSIFLWHSYEENQVKYEGDKKRAMAHAISGTISSVVGSSITTVAGFIALCFMSFTLGLDLGVVMAKGVIFGVICCVTVLPSMILVFDKALEKTRHRPLIPELHGASKFVTKYFLVFFVLFFVILVPALYGYNHTNVYYNLDETLPKDLDSIIANAKLDENYDMNSTHMLLLDSSMENKEIQTMLSEIKEVKGVSFALGLESLIGPAIPAEMIPESVTGKLKSDNHELMVVGSSYKVASEEVNEQVGAINKIIKKYDSSAMIIGEAPCTKDLIEITDKDFKTVSIVSIGVIFIIILLLFKSISLPIILVSTIEFAIFINMGIPFYTNTELPFIASVVIGTIQLGATVDYAILMTTRYRKERNLGKSKKDSVGIAYDASIKSVISSALSFFAATFGVGVYSNIDMISSLCMLMARGALISMCTVLLILPAMFMVFDRVICRTSIGFGKNKRTSSNVENAHA
ncbi:MAG: MMPL family transporter [Lachnospiraceae bacterium]|nr:MMPL family transporter [Lachnospiraceae bacterium]